MKTVQILPFAAIDEFRFDLLVLLDKYTGKATSLEMLAATANIVGQMVAHQDHRLYSSDEVMQLVRENLVAGNVQAVEAIIKAQGGRN